MSPTPPDERIAATATPVTIVEQVSAWADSGAMALTGRRGSPPLGPPAGLVPKLDAIGAVLRDRAATVGRGLDVDPLALLGERAAIAGYERNGTTSCGGATRLFRARDGWLAVSLAREDDVELVPAWLELSDAVTGLDGAWAAVADTVGSSGVGELVERGVLLGLPIATLPVVSPPPVTAPRPLAPLPLRARSLPGPAAGPRRLDGALVVDLSSLWAGPLCGALLTLAGADVVKVESTGRPDGARHGPQPFFDLLNAGKRSVALDLRSPTGRQALALLIARADVVIEASRPRALAQLGIDAARVVGEGGPQVWASITGHGRTGAGPNRVAFGDDAAVAGGLVSRDGDGPCFTADAVPDPATGLVAAAAVLDALSVGGRWLLDASMTTVAAHLAGPALPADGAPPPALPRARPAPGRAARLGEHTDAVLADLVVR